MLDVKELEKTKRVNIVGEIPDVRLQILDNNGKIKEFRLREMTIAGARTEIDQCNRENYCVYYKGVVEILDRFHIRRLLSISLKVRSGLYVGITMI